MKIVVKLIVLYAASVMFAAVIGNGAHFLEENIVALISALLGGIIAGLSIIFGLMSTSHKLSEVARGDLSFRQFLVFLKRDVLALIMCLGLAYFIPAIRPCKDHVYFEGYFHFFTSDILFSSIEIFVALLVLIILFEIVGVLFALFEAVLDSSE